MLKQDIKTTKETDVKYIKKVASTPEKQPTLNAKEQTSVSERPPRTGGCIPVAGD